MSLPNYSIQQVQDEFWFGVWDALKSASDIESSEQVIDREYTKLAAKYKLRDYDQKVLKNEIARVKGELRTRAEPQPHRSS